MSPRLPSLILLLLTQTLDATPFSNLDFNAASKEAAQAHKIVFVDFYTTWCGPCAMLDKNTWVDASVIKLLEQKTVAIRLDAEKETNLAQRYQIEVYPTMLLLKPDGTEFGRLEGYRDAPRFISDFNAALKGNRSTAQAMAGKKIADANDPEQRMRRGQSLAQAGKNEQALAEYLWCFDHGDEIRPSFDSVRATLLLQNIQQLGKNYPPAIRALKTRRDEALSKLQPGSADERGATEIIFLNGSLNQKEENLVVFDRLSPGSEARGNVAGLILDQLVAEKRYADILSAKNSKTAFAQRIKLYDSMAGWLNPKSPVRDVFEKSYRHTTVEYGSRLFEALAGVKHNQEGRELAADILKFDNSPETRKMLSDSAKSAGNEELAQYVQP